MEELLAEARALSPTKQRAVAAFLGALVADAAAQPLHWVYDEEVMEQALLSNDQQPEFMSPAYNPFYRVPLGSQSNYGDQMMVLMRSLADFQGYNIKHFSETFLKAFGPGSSYDITRATYIPGQVDKSYPIQGPWSNRTMKRFIELYQEGRSAQDLTNDDYDDPDVFARALPLLLIHAGSPSLHSLVQDFTSLIQSSDISLIIAGVAFQLIELYVLHGEPLGGNNVEKLAATLKSSPDSDQRSIAALINEVLSSSSKLNIEEATKHFGKA